MPQPYESQYSIIPSKICGWRPLKNLIGPFLTTLPYIYLTYQQDVSASCKTFPQILILPATERHIAFLIRKKYYCQLKLLTSYAIWNFWGNVNLSLNCFLKNKAYIDWFYFIYISGVTSYLYQPIRPANNAMATDKYQGFGVYLCEPGKKTLLNCFFLFVCFLGFFSLLCSFKMETHAFFSTSIVPWEYKSCFYLKMLLKTINLYEFENKSQTFYRSNFNTLESTWSTLKGVIGTIPRFFKMYPTKKTKMASQKN